MKKPDLTELRKIDFEDHLLFHVSPCEFERPQEEFLLINTRWHDNGALGLWCSTFPNMCSGFGKHVYKVIPEVDINIFGWGYSDFKNFCIGNHLKHNDVKSRNEYIEIRKYLLNKNIDIIYIIDCTGFVGEVIFLNYNKIKIFEKVFFFRDEKIPVWYKN